MPGCCYHVKYMPSGWNIFEDDTRDQYRGAGRGSSRGPLAAKQRELLERAPFKGTAMWNKLHMRAQASKVDVIWLWLQSAFQRRWGGLLDLAVQGDLIRIFSSSRCHPKQRHAKGSNLVKP